MLWDYLMPISQEHKIFNCIKRKKEFSSIRQHPNQKLEFSANALYVVEYEKYDVMNSQKERFVENTFIFVNSKDDLNFKPDDCQLNAIIIMEEDIKKIFADLSDILVDFNEWAEEISDALISNTSLEELVMIGQKFIINPFIILDEALNLICFTDNINKDDDTFQKTIELGFTPPLVISTIMKKRGTAKKKFGESSIYTDGIINPYAEVNMPVLVDGKIAAVIYVHCSRVEPSEGATDVLQYFASKLSSYFKRNHIETIQNNVNNERIGNFLSYILSHDLRQDEIMMMAESAMFPYKAQFDLYVIEAQEEMSLKYLLNRVLECLTVEKCFCYEKHIIILSAFIWKNNSLQEHVEALEKRFSQLMESIPFYCSVSRSFEDLNHLKDAYVQACAALDIGKQISQQENPINDFEWKQSMPHGIYVYDKLSLHHMLKTCAKELHYKSMCVPQIWDMLKYDKEKGTDNYKVLYTYLECDRITSEAAQILHMHRNNVNYRIKRMEEVFGIDLSDNEERLRIQMSFRIMDLMNYDEI